MKRQIAGTMVGLGMMAEALTGCGSPEAHQSQEHRSTATSTTLPEGQHSPRSSETETPTTTTTELDPETLKQRRERTMSTVDTLVHCDEQATNDASYFAATNSYGFSGKSESHRFGIDLNDMVFGFDATYRPGAQPGDQGELEVGVFFDDFSQEYGYKQSESEDNYRFPDDMITSEPDTYAMKPLGDSQGNEYDIYMVINRPLSGEISFNVICGKTPASEQLN